MTLLVSRRFINGKRLFSNILIYRAEFCFTFISTKSAFPDTKSSPNHNWSSSKWSFWKQLLPFLNHANNTGCHQIHPNWTFAYQKTPWFSISLLSMLFFFFTQSMCIFLCLAVKTGAVFLFWYMRFYNSWRSWWTLLGKFWDFCKSIELDCPLEAFQKRWCLVAFVILGGRTGCFLMPYNSESFR